jgi:hypothetical protein
MKLKDWCGKHRVFFIFILFYLGMAVGILQSLLLNSPLGLGLKFGFIYSIVLIITELSYDYN